MEDDRLTINSLVTQSNLDYHLHDKGRVQDMNAQKDLRLHISILGWLHIANSAILLVVGGFVFFLLAGIGFATGDPSATAILSIVGSGVGILLMALALPGLLAGYGLLKGKSWGRILAIVVGILGLLNIPIGTLIGVYTLWVLLQEDAEAYFLSQKLA